MTRILLVEDDPMILEIYQKKFTDSGFEVLTADAGEKVLKIAKEEKLDVILLDLIMPKMDGYEILRNLRGGEYDTNIKIIISSNLSQKEDKDKALKLGANGFIAKSDYRPSELIAEVQRFLNQYKEQARNEARINGSSQPAEKNEGAKKILMIEDEEIFIEMFGEKLKQEGYELTYARNGAWGVKEAVKGGFDMFIIDMVMPAMTGDEMVAKIKLDEKVKNVPIIILSASVEEDIAQKVKQMGIDAFYLKTQVTPSELARKVEEIFSQKK